MRIDAPCVFEIWKLNITFETRFKYQIETKTNIKKNIECNTHSCREVVAKAAKRKRGNANS